MSKINTNISVDGDLKKSAVTLFSQFGLDLSTAITLFLQQAVREKRIPFEIRMEIPNQETLEAMEELKEMKKDKKQYKRYSSIDEVIEEEK